MILKQEGKETVLTRAKKQVSNEPRQKEPRELFALWKKSALPDGKIPGRFIAELAGAVEAYVQVKPTYYSADKLPKLLPRFDATKNWAPADVVSLLDDVAYYATDPIEAQLASALQKRVEAEKSIRTRKRITIDPDGAIAIDREPISLEKLVKAAAEHPEWKIIIRADEDVPYANVVQLVEALSPTGVDFSFQDGGMGDATLRVATLQANYPFEGDRTFSMCRPSKYPSPHWFTIGFPASGSSPSSALRIYPNTSKTTRNQWAAAWEPGTDIIWWIDDSDIGKLQIADPKNILDSREGRQNNFSRDFALPDNVKQEFRRLGWVVGREPNQGRPIIGANTGSQTTRVASTRAAWIVKGMVTNGDGKPLPDLAVTAHSDLGGPQLATTVTDANGHYRLVFSIGLDTFEKSRGLRVAPVLPGFADHEQARSGRFRTLLDADEDREKDDGESRDLIPKKPAIANFVMLPK